LISSPFTLWIKPGVAVRSRCQAVSLLHQWAYHFQYRAESTQPTITSLCALNIISNFSSSSSTAAAAAAIEPSYMQCEPFRVMGCDHSPIHCPRLLGNIRNSFLITLSSRSPPLPFADLPSLYFCRPFTPRCQQSAVVRSTINARPAELSSVRCYCVQRITFTSFRLR